MTTTYLSARYANAAHDAAVAVTAERGRVLIGRDDRPADWAALHAWGTPDAYEAPAPAVRVVTPFQFKTALARLGIIQEAEVSSPNLPSVAEAVISQIADADVRITARSRWANMTSVPEDDALLAAMCQAANLPLETIGTVFDLAETIT